MQQKTHQHQRFKYDITLKYTENESDKNQLLKLNYI